MRPRTRRPSRRSILRRTQDPSTKDPERSRGTRPPLRPFDAGHGLRPRALAQGRPERAERVEGRRTAPSAVSSPSPDPRLVRGVDLYNSHQFFECHEVLEQLWLATHDTSKNFYKGLIQIAVAFYHWSRGNRAGALTLAKSACRYLDRFRPTYLGLEVESFRAQCLDVFQWLRRRSHPFDRHLVPPLRWTPRA